MFDVSQWREARYENAERKTFVVYRLAQDLFGEWLVETISGTLKNPEPHSATETYADYRAARERFEQLSEYRRLFDGYHLIETRGQPEAADEVPLQGRLFD